ncbi:hypothetical protein, unlikely [Trypanosoma brucei gambiense DAL972]|uniref:Uncharacterized protein n=1 Tax=Trypanosoma brucei gambiense (strain MHOM/CI/86/DAL972) TaxID=679716 RepID=D0A050_TRYB9|nr:hypothetical protein, unlikely [Trypanosoma brucei gambiense DAL972]CBH16608.1 hypothetical protein, unlikely [Trypanosoma brucei gambiense DAL972]|eukprot:XP_011778872.1 hypothetical protein, unlikely [Trypanosoma brucei gambiense DAL972]
MCVLSMLNDWQLLFVIVRAVLIRYVSFPLKVISHKFAVARSLLFIFYSPDMIWAFCWVERPPAVTSAVPNLRRGVTGTVCHKRILSTTSNAVSCPICKRSLNWKVVSGHPHESKV